ncbi:MAG: Txe/YoeB family addiction module toxin [Clostridia bacterium]|nr:Txe/YoeB family addiction module toxin [Clostridia bacterium]
MVTYLIKYTTQAVKDIEKLKSTKLDIKAKKLIDILRINPLQDPSLYEILTGDLSGAFSRRINIKHRLVYEVMKRDKIIKIIRMWTYYE